MSNVYALSIVKRLRKAGFNDDQVSVVAEMFQELKWCLEEKSSATKIDNNELATKNDFANLKMDIANLKIDIITRIVIVGISQFLAIMGLLFFLIK